MPIAIINVSDSNEKKLFLALAFNNSDKAMQHVFASHRPDLTVSLTQTRFNSRCDSDRVNSESGKVKRKQTPYSR